MMGHWTPQNAGVEVSPTSLHIHGPVYDPLVEPTPARLVALVTDVALMGHTRKMGVFRPVFETLSTLGSDLDDADPAGFLEFPETERDIVIVLGFDCDAATYPSRDVSTIADGQRDVIDRHRAEAPVILDISVAGARQSRSKPPAESYTRVAAEDDHMSRTEPGKTAVAFVCEGNAGRSQMATAFAERERAGRNLDIEIITGGTDPADHVHESVVTVLKEKGIDISDRVPRRIQPADIETVDRVVTMGCSIDEFRPDGWDGRSETWDLDHPGGDDLDAVRAQRDEIGQRVIAFFDDLEAEDYPT